MNQDDVTPNAGGPSPGGSQTEPSVSVTETVPPAPPPEPPIGLAESFVGVFTSPKETLRRVVARPWWFALAPLLLLVIFSTTSGLVFFYKIDMGQFMRDELRQSRFASQMSEAQIEQAVEQAAARPRWVQPAIGAVGLVVVTALIAAIFWLILLAFGGEITYGRSFQAVCWAFVPTLLTTLAFLALLFIKDPNAIDIRNPMATNLAAFFSRDAVAKPVYVLLQAVDIFKIWVIALLSIGLAAGARMKISTAAAAVVSLYGLWVLIRIGFAFVF